MGDWAKCISGQTWRTVVSLNFYLGNTAKVKAKAGSSYWCHETGLWLNGHWHGGSWTLGCLSGCSLRDQGKPSPYSQPHSLDSRNGFDSCYNGDNNPSGSLSCSSCDDQAQGICSTDAPGQHQSHGYMLCCPFFFFHLLSPFFTIVLPPSVLVSSQKNIQLLLFPYLFQLCYSSTQIQYFWHHYLGNLILKWYCWYSYLATVGLTTLCSTKSPQSFPPSTCAVCLSLPLTCEIQPTLVTLLLVSACHWVIYHFQWFHIQ